MKSLLMLTLASVVMLGCSQTANADYVSIIPKAGYGIKTNQGDYVSEDKDAVVYGAAIAKTFNNNHNAVELEYLYADNDLKTHSYSINGYRYFKNAYGLVGAGFADNTDAKDALQLQYGIGYRFNSLTPSNVLRPRVELRSVHQIRGNREGKDQHDVQALVGVEVKAF